MGFKADTSFLHFLSMGAVGVRQTMTQLRKAGFLPIELERYCASNKIWATKVKRLRLPDVMCARTGLRFEIRAKSTLAIKMSDAVHNPDRRWDVGLRDDDIAAFISMVEIDGKPTAAEEAVFFQIKDLRDSVDTSKLGPPKSASEGAERDRTWPACVPKRDGTVLSVDQTKIIAQMRGNEDQFRKQTFTLNGKHPYVKAQDEFKKNVSIIAGSPSKLADLSEFRERVYDPLASLHHENAVDRYAAAKTLPFREELRTAAVPALEALLAAEEEPRVALEVAGSAAKLGSASGEDRIVEILANPTLPYLPMEAVFILTELKSPFAKQQLVALATNDQLHGDERRQAAVWGLGKAGIKAYDEIVQLISSNDENVAMHAIVAFGEDTPEPVLRGLVQNVIDGETRRAAAASEALRLIASEAAIRLLADAALGGSIWALATLGRISPQRVKPVTDGSILEEKLAPMLLLSEGANWLASEDRVLDIAFLSKQNLY